MEAAGQSVYEDTASVLHEIRRVRGHEGKASPKRWPIQRLHLFWTDAELTRVLFALEDLCACQNIHDVFMDEAAVFRIEIVFGEEVAKTVGEH